MTTPDVEGTQAAAEDSLETGEEIQEVGAGAGMGAGDGIGIEDEPEPEPLEPPKYFVSFQRLEELPLSCWWRPGEWNRALPCQNLSTS